MPSKTRRIKPLKPLMVLLRLFCQALIFIFRLRFLPSSSIATLTDKIEAALGTDR